MDYEPQWFQEYDVTVDNIFSVESNALPSYDEIKKLPNKVLLWCGKKLILVSFYMQCLSVLGFEDDNLKLYAFK